MMSGPKSSDLSPLDYQVWGQCWSFITSYRSQKAVPEFKGELQLIWSAVPVKAVDNAEITDTNKYI